MSEPARADGSRVAIYDPGLADYEVERAIEVTAEGFSVLIAKQNQLFIDLDSLEHERKFVEGIEFLARLDGCNVYFERAQFYPSRSGHVHAVLTMDRERWCIVRQMRGIRDWNRFFQPPAAQYYGMCPIALWCDGCSRLSILMNKQYRAEMMAANARWKCDHCYVRGCRVVEPV